MTDITITSIDELRKYIKASKVVLAQIRFGVNDRWTKITKQTAFDVIEGADKNQTPDDLEMYAGYFGTYDASDGVLYFG